MTSFFPVTICSNHANEKGKNIWPIIVVLPVMQDMWCCVCLSSGSFRMTPRRMVSYFTQLVHLGHTINLSSAASLYLGVPIGLLVIILFLDYANISPEASSESSMFVEQHLCII